MDKEIMEIISDCQKNKNKLDDYGGAEKYLISELIKLKPEYDKTKEMFDNFYREARRLDIMLNNMVAIRNKYIEDLKNFLERNKS